MLWEKNELRRFGKNPSFDTSWELHNAHSTKKECEFVQDKLWRRRRLSATMTSAMPLRRLTGYPQTTWVWSSSRIRRRVLRLFDHNPILSARHRGIARAEGEVMTCSEVALALSVLGMVGAGVILSMGVVTVHWGRFQFRDIQWQLFWWASWLSLLVGIAL